MIPGGEGFMGSRMIRLDKFLADAGEGTRSQVRKLIQGGSVRVNECLVRKADHKLDPDSDIVTIEGKIIRTGPEFRYFLLNKPAGYITATEDGRERTVMELVPSHPRGMFPVGRLDKDTEGLLLITNDGALAHRLLSPGRHVEKTCYAKVKGIVLPEDLEKVSEGIDIGDDKKTLPGRLEILSVCGGLSEIHLTITEGRFHQVKRMMEALGKPVIYLKRIRMGDLTLPEDLKTGEYTEISDHNWD